MRKTAICGGAAGVLICAVLAVGCMPGPNVKSMYLGDGTPVPKPDSAKVAVYLRSDPPKREYVTIGEVEISTERKRRSMEDMLDHAREEARKLGGDALIIETTTQSSGSGYTTPVRNLYTGEVMGYSSDAGVLRVLRGSVIVWKANDQ